ncbi:MAG: rod shape-determining protein MreD [Nitrospirae bacterium]|nr:MAG: rod shape-determining protein MreD [Nitrospirota bacterium]
MRPCGPSGRPSPVRTTLGLLLLFLAVPLQAALAGGPAGGVDLSLVATYFCGLYYGKGAGVGSGAALGLFLDGCTLGPPGQHLVGRSLAGYLAGAFGERVVQRGPLLHAVALALLTAAVHLAEWTLLPVAGAVAPPAAELLGRLALEVPLTAAAGAVLVVAAERVGLGPRDTTYYPHR